MASSQSWEEAQTEPLVRPPPPPPRNDATAGRSRSSLDSNRSSLDPNDTTLPLDHDTQAHVNEMAMEHEANRLLTLLSSSSNNTTTTTLSEENLGALLSYLTKLHDKNNNNEGNDNNSNSTTNVIIKWNATNVQLVRQSVKVAMMSSSSGSSSSSMMMDGKMARRLLSDGILPFASSTTTTSTEGNNSEEGEGGGGTPSYVWISKLIKSIVIEDLLPTALFTTSEEEEGDQEEGCTSVNDGNAPTTSNTAALDILLSAFLTRLDSDEISQILPHKSGGGTVDDVLDRLCGVVPTKANNGGGGGEEKLRPYATAAVIDALREFESNLVGGGRLSRKRVWKRSATTNNNSNQGLSQRQRGRRGGGSGTNDVQQQYDCSYVYIDRPTYLLQGGLHSLEVLSSSSSTTQDGKEGGDFDALPSLVYQLGLLPMSMIPRGGSTTGWGCTTVASSTVSKGGDKKKKESEKQRGIRLRRMCLEGIASVLDDDDNINDQIGNGSSNERSGGIQLHETASAAAASTGGNKKNSEEMKEAYRWAKYTSLTHLGNCLRSDPEMSKAVLSLLSGEIVDTTTSLVDTGHKDDDDGRTKQKPFRYARLTPFILAISLSMASSVPRMRTLTLSAIRDLIVEEETIRIKRGLDRNMKSIGMGKPWMDCFVRSLEEGGKGCDSTSDVTKTPGIGHVLRCLISVAKFSESESNGGGVGCASSLLQSLSQLGFLLVDCVKKDEATVSSLPSFGSSVGMQATPVLSANLDISSFNNSNKSKTAETSASHATAAIGRFLLSYLFYQSASASSHFTSTSLASMSNIGGSSSSTSDSGATALCRSILRTSFDKFCGMAPNALEHALLLSDLLKFSPLPMKHLLRDEYDRNSGNNMLGDLEGLDDEQKQMVISYNLTSHHLPALIDSLANVPGGGMDPAVASQAIVPTLGRLLFLMATSRIGFGSLWKRHDLEDHVNHSFLLTKKMLFAPDVSKRKCAANLLITLIGVAAVATSSTSSSSSRSVWSSLLYDMKGCLRRCLTQHQSVVRMEAYSSLVALLPKSMESLNGELSLSAASQDTTSPASSTASGARSSPSSPMDSSYNKIIASIPPSGQHAIVNIASELLLSSLERYVTIPKEDFTDRNARRQRASLGVGLSQMEMVVEEESPAQKGGEDEEMSNPFRFDKCISTRPSSSTAGDQTRKGGKKSKNKNTPVGQSFLAEALNRINEPLPFLIASCMSIAPLMSSEDGIEDDSESNEMSKAIQRLRVQMAQCTEVDEYLKWTKSNKSIFDIKDNIKRAEEMAIAKLATLILVVVVIDVLMNTVEWNNSNGSGLVVMDGSGGGSAANEVEDLFTLRTDAIDKAAVIMSSFVSSKPKKKKATNSKDKKKGKKLKEATNSSQELSQPAPAEKKKKSGKASSVSTDKEEGNTITKVKSNDINDNTRIKNRKLFENVVNNMSPAMSSNFLLESLRQFGAEVMKKISDEEDSDDDDDDDNDAPTRLAKCLAFRRYVITKSLLLMSGSSFIVKAGSRISPLSPGSAMDEKTASTIRISTSLSLGPYLFVEFCSHCYELNQTSISISSSKSPSTQSMNDLSLAQLSLRAFTSCVRGMTSDVSNHALSKAARVAALLSSAIQRTSKAISCSKDGWKFYMDLNYKAVCNVNGVGDDQINLGKALFPFLSLAMPYPASDDKLSPSTQVCLFSELLSNCMYGEATECCYLVSSAAVAFSEPNLKEQLGVLLLRGFEFGGHEHDQGVLGLDHSSDESNDNCSTVSAAISVAMALNSGIDGNTQVPLSSKKRLSGEQLRVARSKVNLSTTLIKNWPEKHQARLEKESSRGMIGIATQIAWALSGTLDVGKNFIDTFDNNSPSKKQLKLALIKQAAHTSDTNFAKEKSSIACTISSAIDDALNNADFVTLKILPHMSDLSMAQRFVSSLLFSVSKLISASAPSSEFMDNGTFVSTLCKSTKRLYGIITKLILSFMSNIQSLTSSKETTCLLDYLTATLMPRVSALLLTLQGQETAGGKFLAESKIESHGKTSALLVFEKEKLDNAILKVGAKMKQAGLEEDSQWLEDHVVSHLNRDFVIKRIEDAKAREAPKTKKSAGEKRKIKSEPKSKKSKKKKKIELSEEDDEEEDGSSNDSELDEDEEGTMESVDADESMDEDGDEAIDLDKLTAEMGEDEEEESDDDDDDEEESEEEE